MEIEAKCFGVKPEIILLHEGLGSVSTWGEFPLKLHEATGKGVYVFSRHGYGKSSRKPAPWGADYMHKEADWLKSHLDEIGFESGYLVGHSDGASIASIYVGKFKDTRVKGLALIAPHFFVENFSLSSIAEAKKAFETTNLREKLARHHLHVDDVFWGWNEAWLSSEFKNWNIEKFLPTLPCPILFLQGLQDQYGTLAQLESLKKNLTQPLHEALIENCQHNPAKEQPKQTLAALKEFIESLSIPQAHI
jgi:pimeloyl-ACP methyl ester carboxylesterase